MSRKGKVTYETTPGPGGLTQRLMPCDTDGIEGADVVEVQSVQNGSGVLDVSSGDITWRPDLAVPAPWLDTSTGKMMMIDTATGDCVEADPEDYDDGEA